MKNLLFSVLILLIPSLALAATADLACSVTASEDENGSKQILNGSKVNYSGGNPESWVHFRVTNKGGAKAVSFVVKRVVWRGDVKIYDPPAETLTLDPAASKDYPAVKVNLPGITNSIEAKMLVNIGGIVKETNGTNNKCIFKFTVEVAQ